MRYVHICHNIRCHIDLGSHRRRNHMSPTVIPFIKTVKLPSYRCLDVVRNPSYIYSHNFIPEMKQTGFVFDVDEVLQVLEDAKTDIRSNENVIMTSELSSVTNDSSIAENTTA